MLYRVAPVVLLLTASALLTPRPLTPLPTPADLTVHEWGTFTSIAGVNGQAVEWVPRQPPGELPCFVERLPLNIKGYLPGTVRMETPVLYFYAPATTKVDVSVRFRRGVVTEWYPSARVVPGALDLAAYRRADFEGRVSWSGLVVSPEASPEFPREPGDSHYYRARATDAVPVRAGSQTEKFLFYRGVGFFPPPVTATIEANGRLTVKSVSGGPVGDVIVFANRGGRIGYEALNSESAQISADLPDLDDETPFPGAVLERLLVGRGLYPKEAAAMVDTWRESWAEEGTRLFYLTPQAMVDEVLPLDIHPAPKSVVRAFVGRLEIVTPAAIDRLTSALGTGDAAVIQSYGRFLQPVADRVLARTPPAQQAQVQRRLGSAFTAMASAPAVCSK